MVNINIELSTSKLPSASVCQSVRGGGMWPKPTMSMVSYIWISQSQPHGPSTIPLDMLELVHFILTAQGPPPTPSGPIGLWLKGFLVHNVLEILTFLWTSCFVVQVKASQLENNLIYRCHDWTTEEFTTTEMATDHWKRSSWGHHRLSYWGWRTHY